jgi:Tol biopolymer transport system component
MRGKNLFLRRALILSFILFLAATLTGCGGEDDFEQANLIYDLVFTDWEDDHPVLMLADSTFAMAQKLLDLDGGIAAAGQVAVSPNGDRIAFVIWEANAWQLYAMHLGNRSLEHLVTLEGGAESLPGQQSWSSDSTSVAYVSFNGQPFHWDVGRVTIGESAETIATVFVPDAALVPCIRPKWSPDGQEVAFGAWRETTGEGVLLSKKVTTDELREVFDPPGLGSVCRPVWSHDGAELAFTYWDDSYNGWLMSRVPAAGGDTETVVELAGGWGVGQTQWAPDDSALVFVDFNYDISDAVLNVVTLDNGKILQLDTLNASVDAGHPQWSPDGSLIAYVKFDESGVLTTIPASGGAPKEIKVLGTGISAGHPQWLAVVRPRKQLEVLHVVLNPNCIRWPPPWPELSNCDRNL